MKRSRSRSLHQEDQYSRKSRHRSRSPIQKSHKRREHKDKVEPLNLPFNARKLSRHDLEDFTPMFALYLDIQKQLLIEDLPENEIKGRWKRFVGKWNYGELAEGWYDPKTLEKALASARDDSAQPIRSKKQPPPQDDTQSQENDDDDYGPALPDHTKKVQSYSGSTTDRASPSIPKFQDLQVAREAAIEDIKRSWQTETTSLSLERRLDRKAQVERLEELAPKAAAGTRERQLEKRREQADSNRAFAANKDAGDIEMRDADVMGDEDSLTDLKRMLAANERKKNEREIRREENLRARRAETEERVKEMREREERTMSMLKEIARARFGAE